MGTLRAAPIKKSIKASPIEKPIKNIKPSPIEKPTKIVKKVFGRPITNNPVVKPPVTPVAKTPTNDVNQYLTNDTTYQSQIAAINKALGDYQANEGAAEGDYNTSYAQNRYDLSKANTQASSDQADDYASRGLFRSGLYGKAYGDAQSDYASKQSSLDQGRQTYLGGLQRDMSNYISSENLSQQQARQDAINRRALALLSGQPTS